MTPERDRRRRLYAAWLRNERSRRASAFQQRFHLQVGDFDWVEPLDSLDRFDDQSFSDYAARAPSREFSERVHVEWRSLGELAQRLWSTPSTLHLVLGSAGPVGAIALRSSLLVTRFEGLLKADADTVLVANSRHDSLAVFDIQCVDEKCPRVVSILRGGWAGGNGCA